VSPAAVAAARPDTAVGYVGPMPAAAPAPSLRVQRLEIQRACRRLGLELVEVCRDEPDGPAAEPRRGFERALREIHAGGATCLVVSGLAQLGVDEGELSSTLTRLERDGARLVAVDVGFDSATPAGRLAIGGAVVEEEVAVEETAAEEEEVAGGAAAVEVEEVDAGAAAVEVEVEEVVAAAAAVEGVEVAAEAIAIAEEVAADPPAEPPAPAPAAVEAVAAVGYASVPGGAEAEGDGAAGIDAQRRAIEASCAAHGLRLVELVGDREPKDGKALDRAGLSHALQRIAAGDARCLVVGSLDRLSRSVADLGTIVHWLERNDVRLVAADLDLDTATEAGRMTARALASVAGWERERLSERTQQGLAAARAKRHDATTGGPDWPALRRRIAGMRADGMTLQAIADVLNAEGVPTQRGGLKWRPSSVQTAAGYRRRTRPRTADDLPRVRRPPAGGAPEGGP
jgi:DNA invertase Pin-like site-specific DNA recombinase